MRALLSLLMAAAALSLTPTGAWAEAGHSHCEEGAATAQAGAPVTVAVSPAELSAPAGPCGECPDGTCSSHRHCAAGTPPVVAEPSVAELLSIRATGMGRLSAPGLAVSFDPTPPTPPPNLRTL